MEELEAGDHAGTGSYRCTTCGFKVSLREWDALPGCPGCGGERFERAPLFASTTVEVPAIEDAGQPEWLTGLRGEIAEAGDYLAFEDGSRLRVVPLADGWTRIGRSLSADVRLDDPTVSRRHALIHRDGRTLRLLDDRSLNGVFRNGRRVDLEELSDGDRLTIGRYELRYLRATADRTTAII